MTEAFSDPQFGAKVQRSMGVALAGIDYPGGESRNTIRVRLEDGRVCYATGRPKRAQSTQELQILWALKRAGVPAPEVLGVEDTFFLQQEIVGERLSLALNAATPEDRVQLMRQAGLSLVQVHRALADPDAIGFFPPESRLNESKRAARAALPREAATYFGCDQPTYDEAHVASLLLDRDQTPIKGDTRPANAIVSPEGETVWIDWDRADRGNRLSDLVRLICDEYSPISPDAELTLVQDLLPEIAPDWSKADRDEVFAVSAVLHCLFRLSLIYDKLARGGHWYDPESCLQKDSIGVAPVYVRQLCARGQFWAEQSLALKSTTAVFAAAVAQLND